MQRRRLPGSDIDLSVLAFGPMRLGAGTGASGSGSKALYEAIEAGITTIHSSEQYGPYEALSELLADHPQRGELEHVIKVQTPEYEEAAFDRQALERQIDDALRALSAERIAVVQHLQRGPATAANAYDDEGDALRIPRFAAVHEPLFEAAEDLKAAGKIGALACFPHTMPFARRAVVEPGFDAFAHFFGPLEVEFAELFDDLRANGQGLIAIRPLLQGMLTDARVDRNALPHDDPKRGANWDPWYDALDAVRDHLDVRPGAWTRFALRFSFTPDVVVTSVVGLNTTGQVAEALAAVDEGPLDDEVVRSVVEVIAARPAIAKATLF